MANSDFYDDILKELDETKDEANAAINKEKAELASLFMENDNTKTIDVPRMPGINTPHDNYTKSYNELLTKQVEYQARKSGTNLSEKEAKKYVSQMKQTRALSVNNSRVSNKRKKVTMSASKLIAMCVASASLGASWPLITPALNNIFQSYKSYTQDKEVQNYISNEVQDYSENILSGTIKNGMVGDEYYNEHKNEQDSITYGSYNNYERINYGLLMEATRVKYSDPSEALFVVYCSLDGYGSEPVKTNKGISYFNESFKTNYKSVEDFMILNEFENVKNWKASVGKKIMANEVKKDGEDRTGR